MTTDRPTISVIVPTHDRLDRLHRVLTALGHQELHPSIGFEVVVVADGCSDGTDQYLWEGHTPIPVVPLVQPNAGPAVARNRGAALASGDLLVFVDDDLVPTTHMLARHLDAHRRHGPDSVVIGPMLGPADHRPTPWIAWEQRMLDRQYDAMSSGRWEPTARQFWSGNVAVPAALFAATGGFDPTYRRFEDVELGFRLEDQGARWVFEPAAAGLHYAERSYGSWLANAQAYGTNTVRLASERDDPDLVTMVEQEDLGRHPLRRFGEAVVIGGPHRLGTAATLVRRRAERLARRGEAGGRALAAGLSLVYGAEFRRGFSAALATPSTPAEIAP